MAAIKFPRVIAQVARYRVVAKGPVRLEHHHGLVIEVQGTDALGAPTWTPVTATESVRDLIASVLAMALLERLT